MMVDEIEATNKKPMNQLPTNTEDHCWKSRLPLWEQRENTSTLDVNYT